MSGLNIRSDLKSYLKATEFLSRLISGPLDFLNKMYVPH